MSKEKTEPTTSPQENPENLPEVASNVNPYQLMDALDDEIIQAELENRIVEHWVYAFKQDGKMVSNLSKAGVDACCTEMAKTGHIIEEHEVHYEQDPEDANAMLFSVVASRVLVNFETGTRVVLDTVNGTKRQSRKTSKGGFNPFWFEQGAMKAARNARIRLIPEDIKVKILALAKEKDRVKKVTQKDANRVGSETPVKGATRTKTGDAVYADDKLKRFVEAWVKQNLDGDREMFKRWAASLDMIHKGDDGKLTMNKILYRFAARIRMNPDDAAANFSRWHDLERAKQEVEEVFGDETAEKQEGKAA